jgi:single-strand DNA-binding protein
VSGRLGYSEWESDGQRRSKHEVIADRVEFLSAGSPEENGGPGRDQRPDRAGRSSSRR